MLMKTAGKLGFFLGLFLLSLNISPCAFADVLFLTGKNNGSVWLWVLTALVAAGAALSLLPRKKREEKKEKEKNDESSVV